MSRDRDPQPQMGELLIFVSFEPKHQSINKTSMAPISSADPAILIGTLLRIRNITV